MKRYLGVLAVLLGATQLAAQNIAPIQAGDIVITGGQLFDGVRDTLTPNTGLIVRSGILLEVGASLAGRELGTAQVVKLAADETILPGFFDLHAHYAIDLFGQDRVDEFTINPLIFLANGVTSTFPAGEVDPEGMMGARRRIERGEQIGPRIHSSGPYFGTARPGWRNADWTPDRIRKDVDDWAARGARGFKAKGIHRDHLPVLIERAHRHGLPVTGHLDSGSGASVNPRDAIYMGIDRIEHFMGGDAIVATRGAYSSLEQLDVTRPEVDAIIELYLKRRVYYDATVSAYGYWYDPKDERVFKTWMDEQSFLTPHAREVANSRLPRRPNEQFRRIYEVKFKEVKRFYDKGGADLITVGTDHPSWGEFLSGFGSHREVRALVLAGIPPAAVLKMATINGARALRMGDQLGSIEAGKLADLVVVRGNPLTDITNTRNVRLVMVRGQLHEAAALLASAKGKMGPVTPADDDWWKGAVRFKTGSSIDR
ncbi:MAG TPA: amidohydrolase family protein [Vicinamibacterales bacterium]|nr:amidohydrolase family protein [Vicinamibacterales bacterium]